MLGLLQTGTLAVRPIVDVQRRSAQLKIHTPVFRLTDFILDYCNTLHLLTNISVVTAHCLGPVYKQYRLSDENIDHPRVYISLR